MYHDPNKFDNIIQLAEGGQLASGCKVMIPTHNNALEVVFGDKKFVNIMQNAFFDVELLFSDGVTTENNPLWDFAVNIDDNDPLWHDAKDGKEANIKGGVENISRHYRDHCSKYGPWVIAIEGGHQRAKEAWRDDIWETMDKYCVRKPLGGLKHLHTTAKKLGDLGGGMHPVMIQFTYIPQVEREQVEVVVEVEVEDLTLCTLCWETNSSGARSLPTKI